MNWNTIFLILCSIGAIQSFFIGVFFLFIRRGKGISNKLLGLLLLAVAVRVAKSTLWLYYSEAPVLVLNIGFGAHLAMAPLLMLYILSFRDNFRWNWYYYLNFIPFLMVLVFLSGLTTDNFWYRGGYSALLYHSLLYLTFSLYLLVRSFSKSPEVSAKAKTWLITLFCSIALFCMAYFLNYEMGLTSYVTGPVIYSGIIYFISFYVLANYGFFLEDTKTKYRNIQLSSEEITGYTNKVKKVVEEDRFYLQPDFSLSHLSRETGIAKHLLSNLFNVHLKKSFTDYTNQFRINRAIELLNDPDYENLKISAIAYDCGFNTLSAFNAAFRKMTNTTPSEFKKKLTGTSKIKS